MVKIEENSISYGCQLNLVPRKIILFYVFPSLYFHPQIELRSIKELKIGAKYPGLSWKKFNLHDFNPFQTEHFLTYWLLLTSLQHFHVRNEYINRKLILVLKEELELFHNLSPQNWIVFILRKRIKTWQFTWTTTPQRQRLFTPSEKLSTNYQKRFVFSSLVRIKIGYANVFQLATIVLQVFFSYLYWLLSVK